MNFTLPISHLCSTCPIANRCGIYHVNPQYPADVSPGRVKYLVIGEAPGQNELQQGVPFIGPAGALLRESLARAGIPADQVAITNACLCPSKRTAKDKWIETPTPEEAQHCIAHSLRMICGLNPKVVITVGSVPWTAVCTPGKTEKITKVRGQWKEIHIPFWVQYEVFLLWLRSGPVQAKILDLVPSDATAEPKIFYGTRHDPKKEDSACHLQINLAKTDLGYSEDWMQTPVMPILHTSYILRQGGPSSQDAEDLICDLRKAKDFVEGVVPIKAKTDYQWITELDNWIAYVDETIKLHQDGKIKCISLDIETSQAEGIGKKTVLLSCFHPKVRILTVQFSRFDHESRVLMVNHKLSKFNDPVSMRILRHHLERLLDAVPTVYQNAVFDVNALKSKLGLNITNIVGDTMLMDHWLKCGMGVRFGLDDIGNRYLGTGKHKTPARKWAEENPKKDFDDMPLDLALDYAAGDSDVTLRAFWAIRKLLEEENRWVWFWEHYFGKHKGWQVISDLVWSGMPADHTKLDALNEEYPKRIAEVVEKINTNPIVVHFKKKEYDLYFQEVVFYNKTVEGSRRRKRVLLTLEEYLKDKDYRYNPGSVPQTEALWASIGIPWVSFPDTQWHEKDICPSCRRPRCRCKPPHKKTRTLTSDHNRQIVIDWTEKAAEQCEKLGDPVRAGKYKTLNDLFVQITEYKKLTKMYGTYVKGLYKLIIDKPRGEEPWDPIHRVYELYKPYCKFPRPWSLHPSYNMHGTTTGRLSSSGPNGQNFPSKSGDPRANLKAPYISRWAGHGGLLIQPDYSQIEVRVMVALAKATKLAEVLNAGKDIHRFVASLVHGVPEDKVTDDMRSPVKRVTFGILYGQTVEALAQELHIPVAAAQDIQDKLFGAFPEVKNFVDSQHEFVQKHSYVITPLGRIRYLEKVSSEHVSEANEVLRESVNTPVQSIASDMCWQAYGRTWQALKDLSIPSFPHSIIHDSQCFDVGPGFVFDVLELQYYQMVWKTLEIYGDWLIVKPEADFAMGTSWGTLCKCKISWDETKTQIVHDRFAFSGCKDDLDGIQLELAQGGLQPEIAGKDGPHPKKEEAERGMWYRELKVTRSNPIVLLQGKELKVQNVGR